MRPLIGAVDGDQFTAGMLGLCVERATATLPQTTTQNIFTITGGRVAIYALVGTVTTIIQNQANNTKLTSTPGVGTAVDMCSVTDIANLEVGGTIFVALAASAALVKANAGGGFNAYGFFMAGAPSGSATPGGSITLNCAASNTGSVRWTLFYAPFDAGAAVAAL